MKTGTSRLGKLMMLITSLLVVSPLLFAEGSATEIYLKGTTNTTAGEFVVLNTDDVFYFQGKVYQVYQVKYDDSSKDMIIAVNVDGECNSFVASNGQFIFFYGCDKDGFGIRKVMFNNPWVQNEFNPQKFRCQSVLCKKRRVDQRMAIETVAAFVPDLYEV
jgi:hypothetical protein